MGKEFGYLDSGRIACTPLYEQEAIESARRYRLQECFAQVLRSKLNHIKNLCGSEGCEGLTGRWHNTTYIRGVPRK